MISTNPPYCLIIIALALLALLLSAANATPVFYQSCDFYGPPSITAKPLKHRHSKYEVDVKSLDQSWGVQPAVTSFNLTASIDKRLRGGRAVIQLLSTTTDKTVTRNVDLCSLANCGCPIHRGNFTVSFDINFDHVFYQAQFSIFAKSGELLTCIFFEESDPSTVPAEPTLAPSKSYEPTPAPSEPYEPTPAPSEPYEPTPAPSKSYHEPTPAPSEAYEPTPAPSEPSETTPSPSQVPASPPSQVPASPPSTAPIFYDSCDWYGPPNITANPPPENNYNVWVKSFDMSWGVQPISHNLTANIDKLLPSGRAVTQLMSALTGKTVTRNVDLCSLTRGGCPILPGDFTVSFNLNIDYFTQIQFSMFAVNGELLSCVFFEESNPNPI